MPARCALRREDEDALAAALDGILDDADWAPYAATLPENPEVLDAWTRAERALLAGTGLAGAGDERSKRRRISARSAALVRSRAATLDDGSWALVPGVDALNDGRGRAAPCTTLEVDGDGAFEMVASRDLEGGEELTRCSGQEFPTSKAPISAVLHSFRLIFGRAIISRNSLEAWILFPERARAEHSR